MLRVLGHVQIRLSVHEDGAGVPREDGRIGKPAARIEVQHRPVGKRDILLFAERHVHLHPFDGGNALFARVHAGPVGDGKDDEQRQHGCGGHKIGNKLSDGGLTAGLLVGTGQAFIEKPPERVIKILRPFVGADIFLHVFLFAGGEAVVKIIADSVLHTSRERMKKGKCVTGPVKINSDGGGLPWRPAPGVSGPYARRCPSGRRFPRREALPTCSSGTPPIAFGAFLPGSS